MSRKYILQDLLNELDVAECCQKPGKNPFVGELLSKQRQPYIYMKVDSPSNPTS